MQALTERIDQLETGYNQIALLNSQHKLAFFIVDVFVVRGHAGVKDHSVSRVTLC